MTADTIQLLADLCEVEPPVVSGLSVAEGENDADWRMLQKIGALTELGLAETIVCMACDEPHQVAVELAPDGGYRAYCPDTGWQPLDGSDLRRFSVNEQWIANVFRASIGLRPVEATPDQSPLVRIGIGKYGPYRTELFFARRISDRRRFSQVKTLVTNLTGESPTILFTSTDPDHIPGDPPRRCAFARLQDVLRVVDGTVTVDEGPIYSTLRGSRHAPKMDSIGYVFSTGYRSAWWGDQYFEFTDKQAMAIEAMYETWCDGLPSMHQDEIAGKADTPQRMVELFRDHPAYRTLIRSDGRGRFWLDL